MALDASAVRTFHKTVAVWNVRLPIRDLAASGVAREAVQLRSAKKFQEKIPAGSGVWIQNESGTWSQK